MKKTKSSLGALCLLLLWLISPLFGEDSSLLTPGDVVTGPRTWLVPAGEIIFVNGVLGAANYYIGARGWAQIGTASIIENFELGFDWDPDGFPCNTLDHPYHGAVFFGAARSVGYSFKESLLFSSLGSLQWEFFMETERPSTNDFIMTSFGGAFLGEILFRASVEFLRPRENRPISFWGHTAGFLTSPPLWVNSRLYPKSISFHKGPSPLEYVALGAGLGNAQSRGEPDVRYNPLLFAEARYNRTREGQAVLPYDYFTVRAELEQIKTGDILKRIETNGILTGSSQPLFKADRSLSGLFASYDYMEGLWYDRFSDVGIGPGMLLHYENARQAVTFYSGIYAIFGAASARYALIYGDTPYEEKDETYNFGSELKNGAYYMGPGIMSRFELSYRRGFFSARAGLRQFWVHSVHATDANEWGYLIPLTVTVRPAPFLISFQYELIHRDSFYDDYHPLYNDAYTLKLFSGFTF